MKNYYYLGDQRYVSDQLNLHQCKNVMFKLEIVDVDGVETGVFHIVKGGDLVWESSEVCYCDSTKPIAKIKMNCASTIAGAKNTCNGATKDECPESWGCSWGIPPIPTPVPSPAPGPAPTPCSPDASNCKHTPTHPPTPGTPTPVSPSGSWRGDIIGYIGSGGCIPNYDASTKINIPDYYNIVVLAFWIGGAPPVWDGYRKVPEWLLDWRNKGKDPWGRDRKLLVSIGGQAGSGLGKSFPAPPVINNIVELCNSNIGVDGIDIDLESPAGTDQKLLNSISNILQNLNSDKIVTLVPEAQWQYLAPSNGYSEWLKSGNFSWISPQFYNDAAENANLPNLDPAPKGQHYAENIPYVMKFLDALKTYYGLKQTQIGLLTPCTTCGANDDCATCTDDNIVWNMTELSRHIKANNIQHVGSWDITYDRYVGVGQLSKAYPWAGTLAQLLLGEPPTPCTYCPFNESITDTVTAISAPAGAGDKACHRKCEINVGDRIMNPLPKPASDK